MTAYALVQQQAEDEGLWFHARTATEAYLMAALRDLHAAVEADYQRKNPNPFLSTDPRRSA